MLRRARKTLVENCTSLDVRDLLAARRDSGNATRWVTALQRGAHSLVVRCALIRGGRLRALMRYTLDEEDLSYSIGLDKTSPHFGGSRWWFLCPIERDGTACGNRVSRLYLPPREKYFGCRVCHDLTYRSTQAPVVSRLRDLAKGLALCEELLEIGNPLDQFAAIEAARGTINSFLSRLQTS